MRYSVLGNLKPSMLGMGCYALGGAYGAVNTLEYKKTIQRAVELGINYFDTADTYGAVAEEFLGEILAPNRKDVYIATKVGVNKAAKPDLSRKSIISACEESLKRLKTYYIDVYNLHFDDNSICVDEPLETLEKLKKLGMIRNYGIGHFSVERAKEYCEKGNVDCIMMELSPVATESTQTLLPLAMQYEAGGIAFSITGMGMMSGKITPSTKFKEGDIRRIAPVFHGKRFEIAGEIQKRFEEIASIYNISPIQLSISWVLGVKGIDIALTGPSKKVHIEENCRAVDMDISKKDIKELEAFLKKQNTKLNEMQMSEILQILRRESVDGETFSELAYVMEFFASEKIIEEENLFPIFRELLSSEKKETDKKENDLRKIREELRTYIN